jgi:long-chain acyl-CoA synthetase
MFQERVRRSQSALAYKNFDEPGGTWKDYTWSDVEKLVARWQGGFEADGFQPGDRVAIVLRNSVPWVVFDQAAMGLDLVTVPLYTSDRPDNIAYIVQNSGAKLLLFENPEQWGQFAEVQDQLGGLKRAVCLNPLSGPSPDPRLKSLNDWLPRTAGAVKHVNSDGKKLASIIYTSGTTGHPKGVMLSHNNMLQNAYATLQCLEIYQDDLLLSFLPLSHTLERTCGYYGIVMCGAQTAFARSVPQLAEDLQSIRPTLLISVPRIYERVYGRIRTALDEGSPLKKKLFLLAVEVGYARFEHAQGRGPWKLSFLLWPVLNALVAKKILARLGGRMRAAISGGAALPPDISRVFTGLGLTVLQGYGLTETSPIACANRPEDNLPASVGRPIAGVQVRIGTNNALMIKGPNIMLGYWNNPEATKAMIGPDGWLNSGDTARIDGQGHVFITGRLKEIIVLSNGEKVPPVDVESAIARDALFEQVMLLGEGKPFLSVMAVINGDHWKKLCAERGLNAAPQTLHSKQVEEILIARIATEMKEFPGYAQVRRVRATLDPWTVENGLLTPTMKLKRAKVMEKFNAEIDAMYAGH